MKKIAFTFLAAAWLLVSCGGRQNEALMEKSSSGNTLEIQLVADQGNYSKETRALIDSIFRQPQHCLPQDEPRFDVSCIPLSSLRGNDMFRMHRNIVVCEIKKNNEDKVFIERDKWATPQVVVEIEASNEEVLRDLLRRYEPNIVRAIYEAEHRRIARAFNNNRNVELMKQVKEKFGFEMTFEEGFRWAKEDGSFAWIRKETKDVSLGVLIYVTPYRNSGQFQEERIYNRLDTLMRRYVPGPTAGSYMGIERRVSPESVKVDFEGTSYCIQTRGLWHLLGNEDRMGGPFITYSMLSPDSTSIIDVTGFVFAPRLQKRNYLMQVEGICNSIKW